MKISLLVLSFFFISINAEITLKDVDQPINVLKVTGVAGYEVDLPCDISPPHENEMVVMILWYHEAKTHQPIFSVDAREGGLQYGVRNWSDPVLFGGRVGMKFNMKLFELQIDPLIPTDSGLYKCRVDFKDSPTKNHKINLTVIVPPKSPSIFIGPDRSYSNQAVNEGSSLTLICETIGGLPSPSLTWYLEDKLLKDTYKREHDDITINRLDIPEITRDFDKQTFICKASNTHLIPPLIEKTQLDINLKPLEVNITNKENYLSAMQTYEIECITLGSKPEAVITWWKGSHRVKHMAKKFVESPGVTKSLLSYVAIIEDDGKYLTCRAENPVVEDSALEDKWKLVVHYSPVVTIKLGSSLRANDINEGDDVYFECEVKANPKVYKLSWFKDGKELHQNVSAGIILPGGYSLVLQSVSRFSAGEYACMAVNSEGSSTSRSITLEVMYAPICKDGSLAQVVGALKHETISLVCGVQAKPPPISFHWTFNNSGELMSVPADRFGPVKLLKRITNQWHGSRLNYTLDHDTDYGTISCSARNKIGLQRTPCLFQIIVAGKPYPLQNCSAIQTTKPQNYQTSNDEYKIAELVDAEWLIVRCLQSFDGGLPLISYELEIYNEENINTIYLNRSEKPSAFQLGPIFEVTGLEPGRNYKLLLYAVNAKGRSDPVILESISLKGVAMYTTGRGSEKDSDYSLLVACFAGGITAVTILVVGITLTLYRRNHPTNESIKSQTHIVCGGNITGGVGGVGGSVAGDHHDNDLLTVDKTMDRNKELKDNTSKVKDDRQMIEGTDDNPDVIPSKLERRSDARSFGGGVVVSSCVSDVNSAIGIGVEKPSMNFRDHLQELDYLSPESVLHEKDTWIYPNGYMDRSDLMSPPSRPNTLPVCRSHDIYTRSLRIQESFC